MPLDDIRKKKSRRFDKDAYKHAISMVESSGGQFLSNPSSSASGKYHFLYNLIKDDPSMKGVTRREFINRPELQESIMDKALDGKLDGYTYGTKYAERLKGDYNTDHDINELTALVHFMGPGNARKYLSDPSGFQVPGKSNDSGAGYLNKFRNYYNKEVEKQETVLRNEEPQYEAPEAPKIPELHEAFMAPQPKQAPIPEPQFPQPNDSVTANSFAEGGFAKSQFGAGLQEGATGAEVADTIGAGIGTVMTAADLANTAFGPTGIDTSGATAPVEVGSDGGAALSGVAKGASAGMAFGPWGAAIGGVVGGAAGLIGNGKAKRDAAEAAFNYSAGQNARAVNNYASGGSINGTRGAQELVTMIENGGSHAENPKGGVKVGTGSNGLPNLLEEKETIWNDYVFSNNIKL